MTKHEANKKLDEAITAAKRQVNVEFEGYDRHELVASAALAVMAEAEENGLYKFDKFGFGDVADFERMRASFNNSLKSNGTGNMTGEMIAAALVAAGTSMASLKGAKEFFA